MMTGADLDPPGLTGSPATLASTASGLQWRDPARRLHLSRDFHRFRDEPGVIRHASVLTGPGPWRPFRIGNGRTQRRLRFRAGQGREQVGELVLVVLPLRDRPAVQRLADLDPAAGVDRS